MRRPRKINSHGLLRHSHFVLPFRPRVQKLVNRDPSCSSQSFKQWRRRGMDTIHEIRNRRLAYPHTFCKGGLTGLSSFQVVLKRFHQGSNNEKSMVPENIGFAYENAIGEPYVALFDNRGMAKLTERTFLERAMEALGERYPREKPTQERLAKLAGVKQPSVYEWGNLGGAPRIATGVRLAKALNVWVEWLYTERGPKRLTDTPIADEHLSPILEAWPNLEPDLKRQVARYTDFIQSDKKPE